MNSGQYSLTVILALVAGFIGGAVSGQFFTDKLVFAQKKGKPMKVIEAEEFRLLDEKGKIIAQLKKMEGEPRSVPALYLKTADTDTRTLLTSSGLYCSEGGRTFAYFIDGLQLLEKSSTLIHLGTLPILPGGQPRLILRNSDGMNSVELGNYGDGRPFIRLSDDRNQTLAVLGYTGSRDKYTGGASIRSPASLILFHEKGKVLWSAP